MVAANYQACEDRVLAHEGSRYTDGVHPYDPGGPTRWGITLADARMYWKANASADDVRTMPRDVACDIYRKHYWAPVRGDDLPSGVDDTVYDYGINSGIGRSGKVLRKVVGLPTNTSAITLEVIEAVRRRDAAAIVNAICDERMLFLQSLKIWPTYRNGWTVRVREVRQFSLQLANATAPVAAQPPTSIPASTMGKGKPPEPTAAKNVAKGAGAGAAAGAGGFVQWLQVHPALCAVIVGSIILTAILVIGEINRWHRQRSEEPHPDTPVVPELPHLVEEFS